MSQFITCSRTVIAPLLCENLDVAGQHLHVHVFMLKLHIMHSKVFASQNAYTIKPATLDNVAVHNIFFYTQSTSDTHNTRIFRENDYIHARTPTHTSA